MLQRITTVTYRTDDLAASRDAVVKYFGYRLVSQERIKNSLATAWHAPKVATCRSCVLQPESGDAFFIRLIEHPADPGHAPLRTYGWNAAELLLSDVDATSTALRDSPFRIIGGPRDLMNNGAAIALQVEGPARELFYLTQISGKTMQAAYGAATCAVDRAFIVVLGAQDMEVTRNFYRPLVKGVTRPRQFAIRVLSAAHKLDADTRYAICGACLPTQNRIEIDAYPVTARFRDTPAGGIPPGISMVSFTTESLDALPISVDIHKGPNTAPYFGCRIARIVGPNNEWIELLESPPGR